jgi:hypothetical protein
MRPIRTLLTSLSLAAAFGASSFARADDSVAAQALFDQAKKAMGAHDYAEACPKLEESLRLQPALGTLLNLAQCYERQGKLASAWSKYLEVAAKARAAGQTERARIGHDRAAALAPKLSNLAVEVPSGSRPDGLEVRRDGTVVGPPEWGVAIPTDAGPHTIEATAPGRKPWSQTVTVGDEPNTERVTVPELEPIPAEPVARVPEPAATVHPEEVRREAVNGNGGWSALRILAVGAVGVGVAGVGVGSVFGLLSLSKHQTAQRLCPSNPCPSGASGQTGSQAWTDAVHDGNLSTVAFVVGGAALAAGVVLWLAAPTAEPTATSAGLTLGPGSVALRGVW